MIDLLLFSGGLALSAVPEVKSFLGIMPNGKKVAFYTDLQADLEFLGKIASAIRVDSLSEQPVTEFDHAICFVEADVNNLFDKALRFPVLSRIKQSQELKKQVWLKLKSVFLER